MRMHTGPVFVTSDKAFVGSQSLRRAELDQRREVGIIVDNPQVVGSWLLHLI